MLAHFLSRSILLLLDFKFLSNLLVFIFTNKFKRKKKFLVNSLTNIKKYMTKLSFNHSMRKVQKMNKQATQINENRKTNSALTLISIF